MTQPTVYFTEAGKAVSGDQKPSMNAAIRNIAAAPYINLIAGLAACTSACVRERKPGAMTALPSFRPAAPESTMALSSIALCPDTKDQNGSLKLAPLQWPAMAPICAPLNNR